MPDKDYFSLATEHFTIEGRSRAGHETWFRVRELGIALDIGRCPDAIIGMPHVFVTHAHLDHALGIPFYAGQRHLQRIEGGTVYVPAEAAAGFTELMKLHERLEGTEYDITIRGISAGETVRIGRTYIARGHEASHRVPARGYEFLELRHHLKKEFDGLEGSRLAELRHRGAAVTEETEYSMLFYTGDTDRRILEQGGAIFKAEVLIIECSFVADGHEERAAKYRHIHFDDIAAFAGAFENRLIVLNHFSRRYSREQIRTEVARRCPAVLRDRIRLALPEPFQRI